MEIEYTKDNIRFRKELSPLDAFVIEFTSILDRLQIKYVLVSGYVSILFGRNRTSEDIDLIVEKLNFDKFSLLWQELFKNFECLNTHNAKSAYNDYLGNHTSIRFSKKGEYIPNMEVKFPDMLNELDVVSLTERRKVILNEHVLFISPMELQISFKMFLGSEKDIEDARFLYKLFRDKLNDNLLHEFNRKLKIEGVFNRYLK